MVESGKLMGWARLAGRVLLALGVAYLFIATLVVATAQQRVVQQLAAENVGYDYMVALKYYFDPGKLEQARAANLRELQAASAEVSKLEGERATLERNLNLGFISLLQGLQRHANECQLTLPTAITDAPSREAVLGASLAFGACLNSSARQADQELQRDGEGIIAEAQVGDSNTNALDDLTRKLGNARGTQASLEESRAALAQQAEMAGKSTGIMPVLDVFSQSSWPMVASMVFIPPTVMAILLAFASGLFGALLITLVLFVYPDNRFSFTRSSSYAGRILLGGLIALGIFVLLFSGVAVLGGSETTGATQNLMAYAAVGILSGMFSDQAAGWLSARASAAMPAQGSEVAPAESDPA